MAMECLKKYKLCLKLINTVRQAKGLPLRADKYPDRDDNGEKIIGEEKQ